MHRWSGGRGPSRGSWVEIFSGRWQLQRYVFTPVQSIKRAEGAFPFDWKCNEQCLPTMRLHHSDCGLWGIDSLSPNLVGWTTYPTMYAVIFDLCILLLFIQQHVKQTRLYSVSIYNINAGITQHLCTASLWLFSSCSRLIEDCKLPLGVSVWVNCVFFIMGEQCVQSVFLPSDCWEGLQHPPGKGE